MHAPEPTTAEIVRAEKLATAEKKAAVALEKAKALALKLEAAETADVVPVVAVRTTKVGKKLPLLPLINASIVTPEPKATDATVAKATPAPAVAPSKARAHAVESVANLAKPEASGEKHIDKGLVERLQTTVDHFSKKKRVPKILLVSGYRPESKGSQVDAPQAVQYCDIRGALISEYPRRVILELTAQGREIAA